MMALKRSPRRPSATATAVTACPRGLLGHHGLDHHGDRFLIITNDEGSDSPAVRLDMSASGEVLPLLAPDQSSRAQQREANTHWQRPANQDVRCRRAELRAVREAERTGSDARLKAARAEGLAGVLAERLAGWHSVGSA